MHSAWVPLGTQEPPHGSCKDPFSRRFLGVDYRRAQAWNRLGGLRRETVYPLGVTVSDLLYVGLTIIVFAVFILIVKGVEHLER